MMQKPFSRIPLSAPLVRAIVWLLKISITLAALVYIWTRLRHEGVQVWESIAQSSTVHIVWAVFALLLVVVNWGLEALKWLWMVRRFYPDERFWPCFQSVLAGIATGIFTPNRVGEYAGRILYLASGSRVEAVVLLFIDRIAQMLVTLLMGTLAVVFLLANHEALVAKELALYGVLVNQTIIRWAYAALIGANILAWALMFNPRWVHGLLIRVPPLHNHVLRKATDTLLHVDRPLLARILGVGIARNIVFSFQYLLLLWAFGYGHAPIETTTLAFAMIWLVFLIKSVIPTIALSELGVRESTAIFIMGIWAVPAALAFGSTFVLYLINIVLPTLVGLLFVQRMKVEISEVSG